jgi:hypothetical protein
MALDKVKGKEVKFGQGQDPTNGGRPKKVQTVIRNLYLDEAGVKLTDGQIKDVLRGYLSKTKTEIDEMLKDDNVPMAIKLGYQLFNNQVKKGNADLFKWLFEMQVGKATQKTTVSGDEESPLIVQTKTVVEFGGLTQKLWEYGQKQQQKDK